MQGHRGKPRGQSSNSGGKQHPQTSSSLSNSRSRPGVGRKTPVRFSAHRSFCCSSQTLFSLGCVCVLAAQSCPALCDAMNCSLPGSSVHGTFQGRILEWVASPFSRGTFLTQGSNPSPRCCRQTLYRLSPQGGDQR